MTRPPISVPAAVAMAAFYVATNVLIHYHKLVGAGMLLLGLILFRRPIQAMLGRWLVDTWKDLNREATRERQAIADELGDRFDPRPAVVLGAAAVVLTLLEYHGDRETFFNVVSRYCPKFLETRYYELASFGYWAGARVLGYTLAPSLVVRFLRGERLRDWGLSFAGVSKHVWIYGVLFLLVLLPVVMVSFTASFQATYPFYKLAARSWLDFLAWEAMYAVQFFALELFFRGFMLYPLRRALGSYAIFAMALPYCMIHYSKPLPEVLGAILAGTVLGTLSLKTGSIWCGVLIHVSVAWTMDTLSLVHTAGYPGNPRLVL